MYTGQSKKPIPLQGNWLLGLVESTWPMLYGRFGVLLGGASNEQVARAQLLCQKVMIKLSMPWQRLPLM